MRGSFDIIPYSAAWGNGYSVLYISHRRCKRISRPRPGLNPRDARPAGQVAPVPDPGCFSFRRRGDSVCALSPAGFLRSGVSVRPAPWALFRARYCRGGVTAAAALYRSTSAPTRFPPPAVVGASPQSVRFRVRSGSAAAGLGPGFAGRGGSGVRLLLLGRRGSGPAGLGAASVRPGVRGVKEAVARWAIPRSGKRPERVNRNERRADARAKPAALIEVAEG